MHWRARLAAKGLTGRAPCPCHRGGRWSSGWWRGSQVQLNQSPWRTVKGEADVHACGMGSVAERVERGDGERCAGKEHKLVELRVLSLFLNKGLWKLKIKMVVVEWHGWLVMSTTGCCALSTSGTISYR
jgi:hypothetical protein